MSDNLSIKLDAFNFDDDINFFRFRENYRAKLLLLRIDVEIF